PEQRGEVADEIAEIDALLGGEEDRELATVPLPFGVGELHHETVRLHPLHRFAARRLVLLAQLAQALDFLGRGEALRFLARRLPLERQPPMRAAGEALVGQLARAADRP